MILFQWNEHPLSCTSGRFWQRALQTAFFEIQHYFSDSQWMREDGCNGIKDCFVVLLFFARHYDEKQWHLLHMIIVLYKGV